MNEYFTSDHHFNHVRILELCPGRLALGATVPGMNEALIAKWNARVQPGDVVYSLGDMFLGPAEAMKPILERLNGDIVLVKGNHDKSNATLKAAGFKFIYESLSMKLMSGGKGYRVFCRHIPPSPDNTWATKADIFLHGHVHGQYSRRGPLINVGVDVCDFVPLTFEEQMHNPVRAEQPGHRGENGTEVAM